MGGLISGLKSVTKGVCLGLTTVVAAPIIGAKEKGFGGFMGGLVGGVLAGATIIATGTCVGSFI